MTDEKREINQSYLLERLVDRKVEAVHVQKPASMRRQERAGGRVEMHALGWAVPPSLVLQPQPCVPVCLYPLIRLRVEAEEEEITSLSEHRIASKDNVFIVKKTYLYQYSCVLVQYTPDHLLLDNSAPNFGPLIFRWEINKFGDCWYKRVRILEVLELLFQQFLNLSSSQRDMSDPILGDLSNNRWSGGSFPQFSCLLAIW